MEVSIKYQILTTRAELLNFRDMLDMLKWDILSYIHTNGILGKNSGLVIVQKESRHSKHSYYTLTAPKHQDKVRTLTLKTALSVNTE